MGLYLGPDSWKLPLGPESGARPNSRTTTTRRALGHLGTSSRMKTKVQDPEVQDPPRQIDNDL